MNDIEEKYAAEVKEKKKKLKRAAGEQHEEEEAEKLADEPEEEEEDPQQTELKHMLVGEEPNLPIPEQELKGEKLEKARIFISNPLPLIDYFFNQNNHQNQTIRFDIRKNINYLWGVPKMGVPPNHSFFKCDPKIITHQLWFWGCPNSGKRPCIQSSLLMLGFKAEGEVHAAEKTCSKKGPLAWLSS